MLPTDDPLMVHHASIGERPAVTRRFDAAAVHPFDGLKVALEQIFYAAYLTPLLNNTRSCLGLVNRGIAYARSLPAELHAEADSMLAGIYREARAAIASIDSPWSYAAVLKQRLNPATIKAIYLQPQRREYIHRPYLSTMTEDFLDIALHRVFSWYDVERYPEGILYNASLYYPQMEVVQNYDPGLASDKNSDYQVVCYLKPLRTQGYTFATEAVPSRYDFLQAYDLKDYSIDELIGILASYSVDHTTYAMTPTPGIVVPMSDVCFDLVTGSTFTQSSSGSTTSYDADDFFKTVAKMVENGRLRNVQDKGLFGELLQRVGSSQELIGYFTKPVNAITAAEAFAFRNSIFASLVDDRITGMEAAEDDPAVADPNLDATGDPGDTGTSPDPAVDPALDTPSDTSDDTKESEAKPSIDPNKMLLEIAKPDEPMSDYIFRDMIARRISNVIKNPPENAMPNDLLMLKRWRSRWLYLVSTPCLRDFLTRVSLRLTNI